MLDSEKQNRFIQLRAQGWSFARIATELELAKSTLIEWSRKCQHEIQNLRAIQKEAWQEQYCLTQEVRLQSVGDQLKMVQGELAAVGPSRFPTGIDPEIFPGRKWTAFGRLFPANDNQPMRPAISTYQLPTLPPSLPLPPEEKLANNYQPTTNNYFGPSTINEQPSTTQRARPKGGAKKCKKGKKGAEKCNHSTLHARVQFSAMTTTINYQPILAINKQLTTNN